MAKLTPIKAIRAKCIDCCCGQRQEVRLCTVAGCPLHEYRMGKRPKNHEEASDFSADSEVDVNSLIGDETL